MHGYFAEGFVDLHDLDLVSEARPAAQHVGIFLGDTARSFRVPVAQKNKMMLPVAVEHVAAVSLRGDNRRQLSKSVKGGGLHFVFWFYSSHREYLLRHKQGL